MKKSIPLPFIRVWFWLVLVSFSWFGWCGFVCLLGVFIIRIFLSQSQLNTTRTNLTLVGFDTNIGLHNVQPDRNFNFLLFLLEEFKRRNSLVCLNYMSFLRCFMSNMSRGIYQEQAFQDVVFES